MGRGVDYKKKPMLKLAYCGDDCNYCPRYLATISYDEERLKEVAAMWQIIGWRDTTESPEKLTCYGCASAKICGLGIKECVIKKGIDNCGKCPDYPCERLQKIFEDSQEEAIICKENFSEEDSELFGKAFFSKKERLDKINREYRGN